MIHTKQEWKIGETRNLLRKTPDESIDTVITSPPYWGLRDYGVDGQIGLEQTLEEYHERMLEVTAECMRVLKPTGVMFWNHGDSYGANKSLDMQNSRLIIKMIDDQGWILRNFNIWYKPNGMPSSAPDRFTNKYEPVYVLTKNRRYWFDLDAVRVPHKDASMGRWCKGGEDTNKTKFNKLTPDTAVGNLRNASNPLHPLGKNPGDVVEMTQVEWLDHCADLWDMFAEERGDILRIPTQPYSEAHFATFPTALIEPMIKVACPAEICSVCGMARERITEPTGNMITMGGYGSKTADHIKASPTSSLRTKQVVEKHTIGWTSCACDAGWIAGTVLDPFCGSGTVLEVCRLLNRNAIGFELNPEYEPLIRERSMAHTPPLTAYCGGE